MRGKNLTNLAGMMMTIIFISSLDVSMHTIHFDGALRLLVSLPRFSISLSLSLSIRDAYPLYDSLCGKLLCSIIFLEATQLSIEWWKRQWCEFSPVSNKKRRTKKASKIIKRCQCQCCAQRALKRQLIFMLLYTRITWNLQSVSHSVGKMSHFVHRVYFHHFITVRSSLLLLCVHLSLHSIINRRSL